VGGELLLIEVAIMPGKGNVKVTGKLGERTSPATPATEGSFQRMERQEKIL